MLMFPGRFTCRWSRSSAPSANPPRSDRRLPGGYQASSKHPAPVRQAPPRHPHRRPAGPGEAADDVRHEGCCGGSQVTCVRARACAHVHASMTSALGSFFFRHFPLRCASGPVLIVSKIVSLFLITNTLSSGKKTVRLPNRQGPARAL